MRSSVRTTAATGVLLLLLTVQAFVSIDSLAAEPNLADAEADDTLTWNGALRDAILHSDLGNPAAVRIGAIVHTAMFDAYNAVERRYESIHIQQDAPKDASARAALIQAAYATLSAYFPKQAAKLDAQRTRSLAQLAGAEKNTAIERGLDWGATVAREILAWRARDGFDQSYPSFTGGNAHGQWRSTTSPASSMAAQNMGFTAPFALTNPTQFEFAAPRGLGTAEWQSDYDEVKRFGAKDGSARSADQTAMAFFWNGYATIDWCEAAEQIARGTRTTHAQNVRIFALLNIALADAAIVTFNAKRRFGADPALVTWRPETAIL